MIEAIVLAHTEIGKPETVAAELREIEGVIRADPVTGPYDVILRVQSEDAASLGRGALARIQEVAGITRTITCQIIHV